MQATYNRKAALLPYLCLLPAIVLMVGVLYVPIVQTLINAFAELDRYGNRTGWAGWANFKSTWEDSEFRAAFWNTALWTFWVVVCTLLISFVAALFLNKPFHGRRLARAILVLPWASSLVISAMVWRFIYDGEVGPLNYLLEDVGIIEMPIYWLATRDTSFPAMIWVAIFVSIPFTTTVFLAGLQSIPSHLREAAQVDGASPARVLWHITLPHLRNVMTIAVILNVINVFNSFPIVWTITRGDPAGTTDIIMTFLYKKAFTDQQFAIASAQAVIVFGVLLVFSILYSLYAQRKAVE